MTIDLGDLPNAICDEMPDNPAEYAVIHHEGEWWTAFEGTPRQLLVPCDTEEEAWAAVLR
jgi:hypothetical protein